MVRICDNGKSNNHIRNFCITTHVIVRKHACDFLQYGHKIQPCFIIQSKAFRYKCKNSRMCDFFVFKVSIIHIAEHINCDSTCWQNARIYICTADNTHVLNSGTHNGIPFPVDMFLLQISVPILPVKQALNLIPLKHSHSPRPSGSRQPSTRDNQQQSS